MGTHIAGFFLVSPLQHTLLRQLYQQTTLTIQTYNLPNKSESNWVPEKYWKILKIARNHITLAPKLGSKETRAVQCGLIQHRISPTLCLDQVVQYLNFSSLRCSQVSRLTSLKLTYQPGVILDGPKYIYTLYQRRCPEISPMKTRRSVSLRT